jgi:hypothetical protein
MFLGFGNSVGSFFVWTARIFFLVSEKIPVGSEKSGFQKYRK